jgi:ATP-dependent protease HslVU (ClpYQ) peptidase subunit
MVTDKLGRNLFMTCIAALKANGKVYMAGERGASTDNTIMHITKPKIKAVGPYIIGFAGSMDGQKLQHAFHPPKPHPDEDLDEFMHTKFLRYLKDFYDDWWIETSKDSELTLLIAIKDKLYEHNAEDMSLNEFSSGFVSIGSGSDFAMGYLFGAAASKVAPEKIIEGSIKAAIKFSPTCSGTIDILST